MIVGIDVSSKRIDLAWLDQGKPCRWHQQLDAKGHLIDRLRSIDIKWPRGPITRTMVWGAASASEAEWETTEVAIEMPYSANRNAIAALMATVGVITRQAPPWARVAWPSAGELRAAIGARNTKASAHAALFAEHNSNLTHWDEHELDALVACIGWGRILDAQDAA